MRKPDHWFRAGGVERGARYEWRDGYSRVPTPGIGYQIPQLPDGTYEVCHA